MFARTSPLGTAGKMSGIDSKQIAADAENLTGLEDGEMASVTMNSAVCRVHVFCFIYVPRS